MRNKKVDQFIKYFSTKGRPQFEIWLGRLEVYGPVLSKIIKENNLPPELLYLAMIESGLNPKAHSKAAATGMWQFIYSTGKIYGLNRNWYIDERRDPEKATKAAMAYLSDLYEEFDNWYLALAAYNAGEGRIRRATRLHQTSDFWQLHSLPRETRNYMPYFLAATIMAKNPKDYGFSRIEKPKKPYAYDYVTIEKSADLTVLSKAAGTSFKILQGLNPELRQSATPSESYELKIPTGTKKKFLKNYSELPENERFAPQFITHKVRNGESLWYIARKYRVSQSDISAVNKLRNRNVLRIGQKITIPVPGMKIPSLPDAKTVTSSPISYSSGKYSNFGFEVPKSIDGIDSNMLNPRNCWLDTAAYDAQADKLINMFIKNCISLLLFLSVLKADPTGFVKGKVIDINNQLPLAGANIIIKSTSIGTISDDDGYFSIKDLSLIHI